MKERRTMFFIFHGRFPSEKAAALFAARSIQAFSEKGINVIALFPRRLGRSKISSGKFYGLKDEIDAHFLATIDLFWIPYLGKVAFWVSFLSFSISVFVYVGIHYIRDGVVYTNESLPALLLSILSPRVVYEMHDFPEKSLWLYKKLFQRVFLIVTTNTWKSNELGSVFGVSRERIFVEPNAVDIEMFQNAGPQIESRRILDITNEKRICVYTGHLYDWKGVHVLAAAAHFIPDILVYFVGGTDADTKRFQERWGYNKNVRIVGYRPHLEMPLWQKAANVLVLPNAGTEKISTLYTSPMKLFEYMASGVPVVASDLPSIREITPLGSVVFVPPDNPEALAKAIHDVASGTRTADVKCAQNWVQNHSWEKRASRICSRLFS